MRCCNRMYRGSRHRVSKASRKTGWKAAQTGLEAGIDKLVKRGIVDPERVGIMGFSNGGLTRLYMH